MKTETFASKVEQAYGKTLDTPVPFNGSFEAFETYEEIVKANEVPSNDDVVKIVNAKRRASARAEATTKALEGAGIFKPDPKSEAVVTENMVKSLMLLHKIDEATARQIMAMNAQAIAQLKPQAQSA